MNSNEDKKTASTRLRNFIQPILVKKSYLYLGTPPLIKIRRAMSTMNLPAMTRAAVEVVFNRNSGNMLNAHDVKVC